MLAYISFAADTAREQELLMSAKIGRFAYTYVKTLIDSVPELSLQAVLAGGLYPFLNEPDPLPVKLLPRKERYRAERECLYATEGGTADWKVIIRPLQGRVSLQRLLEFTRQLSEIENDSSRDALHHAVSVVPFVLGAHPLWQCRAASRTCGDGASVRISKFSPIGEKINKAIYAAWPESDSPPAAGSQDMQPLYHDDNALCALRHTWDFESDGKAAPAHPIATNCKSYLEALPVFFRLPFFEMDPTAALSLSGMEKLAE